MSLYSPFSCFCLVFTCKSSPPRKDDCSKKKKDNNQKTKKPNWLLTCQEPLWSFSSECQTGRWSSHSPWRHCRSHRASWGKHQSRFLMDTSHCPWTPLGDNEITVRVKREKGLQIIKKKKESKENNLLKLLAWCVFCGFLIYVDNETNADNNTSHFWLSLNRILITLSQMKSRA